MVCHLFKLKRNLLSYSLTTLGLLTVFSCTDEVVEKGNPVNPNGKLSGIIDNGLVQTYTSLGGTTGDASRTINWNSGDEVHFLAITNGTDVSDLGSAAAEDVNGVNANFVVTPPVSLTNYVAFYPSANFILGSGTDEGKVSLSIPSSQTYVVDGVPDDTYPMIAVGTVSPLKFKGVAGVLRFELTGETGTTIDKIVFRSTGVKMSGASDWIDPLIYVEGAKLTFTSAGACDSVVLSCPSTALSSTPVSFYMVVADTIYPATTTEIHIEGSNGRKVYTASQPIVAETNRISARSLFYGGYDVQKEYDAHFIVGDTLELGTSFLNASVTGGGNWLTLSVNAPYKESEQTQNYSGSAPLFVHLDENLTGSERSALITATRSNGSVLKVLVKQQSAIYAGPFGGYNKSETIGGPSEGTIDDSGQATPFSMQLRNGNAKNMYTKGLYMECFPEYVEHESSGKTTTEIPLLNNITNASALHPSTKDCHDGLRITQTNADPAYYSTYKNGGYLAADYPILDYCASKNRDTNGDGIVSGDEIKWYTPAYYQLFGMWISNNSDVLGVSDFYHKKTVSDEQGSFLASSSFSSSALAKPTYRYMDFSNGESGVRSTELVMTSPFNPSTYLTAPGVRCVRDFGDLTTPLLTLDVAGNPIVDFSALPSASITETSKGLAVGDELSEANKTVYKRIRISNDNCQYNGLTGGYTFQSWSDAIGIQNSFDEAAFIEGTNTSRLTGCNAYYEESDMSDIGTWRLPTQREYLVIDMMNSKMMEIGDNYINLWVNTLSASETSFYTSTTRATNLASGCWVYRYSLLYQEIDGLSSTRKYEGTAEFYRYVRCVKEVQ